MQRTDRPDSAAQRNDPDAFRVRRRMAGGFLWEDRWQCGMPGQWQRGQEPWYLPFLFRQAARVLDLPFHAAGFAGGIALAGLVTAVVQLFVFLPDYKGTESVQFEDEDYYYYVRAVPKLRSMDREVQKEAEEPRRAFQGRTTQNAQGTASGTGKRD